MSSQSGFLIRKFVYVLKNYNKYSKGLLFVLYTASGVAQIFFPLLRYVIIEVVIPLLIGLALASSGSVLDLSDIGSTRHRGSF